MRPSGLVCLLLVGCGAYEPAPKVAYESILGSWLQIDSSSVTLDPAGQARVSRIDSTRFTFLSDSLIQYTRQTLLGTPLPASIRRGPVLHDSAYTDMANRQVVLVRLSAQSGLPELEWYRFDECTNNTLWISRIQHDSLSSIPNSGTSRYNETATVLASYRLVRQ